MHLVSEVEFLQNSKEYLDIAVLCNCATLFWSQSSQRFQVAIELDPTGLELCPLIPQGSREGSLATIFQCWQASECFLIQFDQFATNLVCSN